ncbi:MAG TPA: glycosyltransferase, partial [Acidobacteriaceae bacterium]
ALLSALVHGLRRWDVGASRQPDHFVANSSAVAARILRAYGRHAEIIHPPIDIDRFRPGGETGDYYLVLARLVSYKRIDLAVEACKRLGRKLLIIGDGSDRERLEEMAGPTIHFLGRVGDAEVEGYAARCRALIFPGEEDFGMAPVEVAAAGRPTIAFRGGGAVETIVDGTTGVFFDRQEPEDVVAAIERFEEKTWSSEAIRSHAEGFGVDAFQTRFRAFLERVGAPVSDARAFPMADAGAAAGTKAKAPAVA